MCLCWLASLCQISVRAVALSIGDYALLFSALAHTATTYRLCRCAHATPAGSLVQMLLVLAGKASTSDAEPGRPATAVWASSWVKQASHCLEAFSEQPVFLRISSMFCSVCLYKTNLPLTRCYLRADYLSGALPRLHVSAARRDTTPR